MTFGTDGGLSRYDGQEFTTQDGLVGGVLSISEDREGNLWLGTFNGVSRYDGREFVTFTTQDGLAHNHVKAFAEDKEGHLWFGTNGGVSRYDGGVWTTFTAADGLVSNTGYSVAEDREGNLWIGTRGGVSRFDGEAFVSFTMRDGLPDNVVLSLLEDRRGDIWLGTSAGGVSRYDGREFHSLTSLAGDWVTSILEDSQGTMWFGTRNGVSRYDGREFHNLTIEDGLANNWVNSLLEDSQGIMWLGTMNGVSRFDGQTFKTYTAELGLEGNAVWTVLQDRKGHLWFGTRASGVSRYDGQSFTSFTTQDGLGHNGLRSMLEDRDGHLWFGTDAGVVSRYDGQTFQTLTREDGLTGDSVRAIHQDEEGCMWFVTYGGVTRFCPPAPAPAPVVVDAVIADRRYEDVAELALPSTVGLVTVEFHGVSLKTRPGGMVYRYRLNGHDEDWRTTTEQHADYEDISTGSYTFEVLAIDRDLVRSQAPATLQLTVHLPYGTYALWSGLLISLGLVAWQTERVVRRDRRLSEQNRELVVEQALERVRTQVAGMQESQDLGKVVAGVEKELKGLDVPCAEVGINVIDGDTRTMQFFSVQGGSEPFPVPLELDHFKAYWTHWREGRKWSRFQSQEDFQRLVEQSVEHGYFTTEEEARQVMSGWTRERWVVDVPFAHGALAMNRPGSEPFTDDDIALLERFTEVFALGYRRYLDLEAAEERARQAELDRARQRVRGEVMSMKQTKDILGVVGVMRDELNGIGVTCDEVGINIIDEVEGTAHTQWSSMEATQTEEAGQQATDEADSGTVTSPLVPYWRDRKVWSRRRSETGNPDDKGWVVDVPFEYGTLAMNRGQTDDSAEEFTQDEIEILGGFAEVVSLGYTRFLDFQRLEAQNRTLEEQNVLIQEATRLKSDFLARMSHDLRTPMNAIIGYTGILLRRAKGVLDERQFRNLDNIQTSANNLLSLINDILDLSKIEAGGIDIRPEDVDLGQLVTDCMTSVRPLVRPGVQFEERLEPMDTVHTDPDRLQRVVMNLLSNAVKFTGEGSITVSLKSVDEWVELSVVDTGPGIPAADLPFIFEEFRQVEGEEKEGTGLGLSIAKKSIELLGGTISAESEVGEGTTFTLRIRDYEPA